MLPLLFNISIFVMFLAFLWYFFMYTKAYSSVLLLNIFFSIWLVASVVYIEVGVYNKNLLTMTYFSFSTFRLLIYEFIFYFVILFVFKFKKVNRFSALYINKVNSYQKPLFMLNIVVTIYTFYLFLDPIVSGNVFTTMNLTRFNYYTSYSILPAAQICSYFLYPMLLIEGVIFADTKRKSMRVWSLFILFVSLITAYMTGNEFGVILYSIFYFFLPWLITTLNNGNITQRRKWINNILNRYKKQFLFGFCAVVAVCVVKVYSFTKVNVFSEIVSSPVGAFLYRALALQGDTWWAVDQKVLAGMTDFEQLKVEFAGLFDANLSQDTGIYYLMQIILPTESYQNYIWGSATLMSGYPAIDIVIWGYWGAILIVVLEAVFFALFSIYVYKKILTRQYLRIFMSLFVYVQLQKVVNVSGYSYLTNTIPLIFLVLLILIEFFSGLRLMKRNKILN
jgi:hypothetical protein